MAIHNCKRCEWWAAQGLSSTCPSCDFELPYMSDEDRAREAEIYAEYIADGTIRDTLNQVIR